MVYRYHNYKYESFDFFALQRNKNLKSFYLRRSMYFIPFYFLLISNMDIIFDRILFNKFLRSKIDKSKKERIIIENTIKYNNAVKNDPVKYFSQF